MINLTDNDFFLNDITEDTFENNYLEKKINSNENLNTTIISKNKFGSLSFTKNLCDLENQNKRYNNDYLIVRNKKIKK